jgi:hypothetical protein
LKNVDQAHLSLPDEMALMPPSHEAVRLLLAENNPDSLQDAKRPSVLKMRQELASKQRTPRG